MLNKESIHFDGGNKLDDIRIDIARAHLLIDEDIRRNNQKNSIRKNQILNYLRYKTDQFLLGKKLQDFFVNSGLKRQWFDDFNFYWRYVLGGDNLSIVTFFMLWHDYRKKFYKEKCIETDILDWETPSAHLQHWQEPENIFLTFWFCYKSALHPIRLNFLQKIIKPKMRILEYGCAFAPIYQTYKKYLNHIPARWVLADIPNFPFHYAKHLYRSDNAVESFLTITEDKFDNPLKTFKDNKFDIIFIQETFEHLDNPEETVKQLTAKLKPQGLLVFDYIKSDGTGFDTQNGLTQRKNVLKIIDENFDIIQGEFEVSDKSLGLCIAKKL